LPSPFYTLLLLKPDGFDDGIEYGRSNAPLRKSFSTAAELYCIRKALKVLVSRWNHLESWLSDLLRDDFMDSGAYVKLLFDDGNFTRSQCYFWAIACLNEFRATIIDTIKHLDYYHEARIKVLLDSPDRIYGLIRSCQIWDHDPSYGRNTGRSSRAFERRVKEEFEMFVKHARKTRLLRDSLSRIEQEFGDKLERVKELREGVSNNCSFELEHHERKLD
jgi:hypothetical protein